MSLKYTVISFTPFRFLLGVFYVCVESVSFSLSVLCLYISFLAGFPILFLYIISLPSFSCFFWLFAFSIVLMVFSFLLSFSGLSKFSFYFHEHIV